MVNPWKKVSTKIVYENPWFRVREDQVEKPGNRIGVYGVVETPPSVFIVALNEREEVYLIGLFRYPTGKYGLEIPAGNSENEEPLLAAKKELLEETGLEANEWVELGKFHPWNGISAELSYVFLARNLKETGKDLDPNEGILEVRKIAFAEVFNMIKSGEINDGQSISALTLAKIYLKKP